ncbi:MAG: TldD/PmbA family protein [Bacteroidales bacterium]|nr:TldD/PmbA family protein [Bacteroidales bacterium]MBQ8812044.1 TldD/PmbA family protein [Bacteroidales bacterium]
MDNRQHYLDIFNVSEPQLQTLAAAALSHGGDFCDMYFEHTTFFNLLLKDGVVSSGGFHTDFGVGIRVLKGEKTGYAYSENTEMEDMLKAAKAASTIALGASGSRTYSAVNDKAFDLYPMQKNWRDCSAASFLPFLKDLERAIFEKDGRIVKVIARMSDSVSDVMMYNSLGELTCDTRPMGSVTATAVFQQNGRTENATVSRSYRTGAELIGQALIAEIAGEVVKGIDERFEARRPKGGQMSVVMGAGASGILLHEAMGHAFEADFNRKGQSIFSDRLGTQVCPKGVNVVDDGTVAFNRGSGNYDDEGVPAQKTYMVRDGVLESYLHDRISAAWYGVPSTGNGRRENFRYNPIPRMRATYMESGDADPADIIASVTHGIYVDEFSNGQVKIGEGDFTFFVKSGFLIEGGRLTAPVKDINIIGNGPQALADIVAVGNDFKIDDGTWTCGKEQSVPVSCGMPTVLVNNLTVGGE